MKFRFRSVPVAGVALLAFAAAAVGQFQNPGFDSGALTPWSVSTTPNGQTLLQVAEIHDLDGPGPLPSSNAAKFSVGQVTFTQGHRGGVELWQVFSLPAGPVTFECDVGAFRPTGPSNVDAGRFAIIVNGFEVAVRDLGSIAGGGRLSAHLSGNFNVLTSGAFRVGVRITRGFTPPTVDPIFQFVDNFKPQFDPGRCMRFVHSGRGSGTLNGVPFGPADFVITSEADLGARDHFNQGFFIEHTSSSIQIAGVGTVRITVPTLTLINDVLGSCNYRLVSGAGLYRVVSGSLVGWDITTPIGPITGNAELLDWVSEPVTTSGGVLVFNPAVTQGSFEAAFCESCGVIDFQGLERNNSILNDVGDQYEEDGYRFTKPAGPPTFAVFGTQEGRYPGSTALFNNAINGLTTLRRIDGATFNITSIDLANLNSTGPAPVTFTGFYPGGASVVLATNTGDPNGLPNTLHRVVFPNTFCGLDRLEWRQVSAFHQFDNLHVATPTRIDFQLLEHVDPFSVDQGVQHNDDSYRLTKGPGEAFPFVTLGTQHTRYPGSTSLFNNSGGGNTILQRIDGEPFDLCEIKLANLGADGPAPVNFTGTRLDGSTVNHNTNTGDPIGLPTTLNRNVFPANFRLLTKVEWTQAAPFHQFDDIVVACSNVCYACDCDLSSGVGVCDVFDFLCFQNAFTANDPYACDCDIGIPGVCNIFDFLCFQNRFDQDCGRHQ